MNISDELYYKYHKIASYHLDQMFGTKKWVTSSIIANGIIYNKYYNLPPMVNINIHNNNLYTFEFQISIYFINSEKIKNNLKLSNMNNVPDEIILNLPSKIKVTAQKKNIDSPFIKIDNINLIPPLCIKNNIKYIIFNETAPINNNQEKLAEYYNSSKYKEFTRINNILSQIVDIIYNNPYKQPNIKQLLYEPETMPDVSTFTDEMVAMMLMNLSRGL